MIVVDSNEAIWTGSRRRGYRCIASKILMVGATVFFR